MDAHGLLGLSTIAEELRGASEGFGESVAKLGGSGQEVEDEMAGARGSHGRCDESMVSKARRLLNREVRVGVEDGRLFVGKLHCVDKQKNVILCDAVEFRRFGEVGAEERSLGLVLIPARCRTSCHVKCSLDEKMDFLKM